MYIIVKFTSSELLIKVFY